MATKRILLAAYQCGPGLGSVSQIGWEWYSRLSAEHDVTLVTHVRNREALAAAGAPCNGSRVIYIDTEWFAGPLYRLARRLFPKSEHAVFMLSSLDYFLFDFLAWRQLHDEMRRGTSWSLLHRVTPVTLAAPSWLGRLGLPVVLGPLNCGLGKPRGFDAILRQESSWLVPLRRLGAMLDRIIGSTRGAARILTATAATLAWVPGRHRARCRPMLENGIDADRFPFVQWPCAPSPTEPLRVLFVGRLIALKGVDMLLGAVAELARSGQPVALRVVGDGPMRKSLHEEAARLGIGASVHFTGALPAEAVATEMAGCHVFCLPSVRESGGAVLLEAMACGRPVVALDFGGPAEVVDDQVGRLLPALSPGQVVADLATALADACRNPAQWRSRGITGRRRAVARYSWDAKMRGAEDLYQELLNKDARHA